MSPIHVYAKGMSNLHLFPDQSLPEIVWQDDQTAHVTVTSDQIETLGLIVLNAMRVFVSKQAGNKTPALVSSSFDVLGDVSANEQHVISVQIDRLTPRLVFASALTTQDGHSITQITAIYRRS